jgi:hypothetical protein
LLVLLTIGGGLASPLVVSALAHWTASAGTVTAEEFLSALRDGDAERLAPLLIPAEGAEAPMPRAARLVVLASPHLRDGTFSLGTVYRRNDTLVVPLVLQRKQGQPAPRSGTEAATGGPSAGEVVLRRADGHWRVSGLRLPATPQAPQQLDLDLVRPSGEWIAAPPSESPAVTAFDKLSPVTPEEFAAAWQTDVDADDVPAIDLLRKLLPEAGYPIQTGNPLVGTFSQGAEEALSRRVSLHLHKVSRLQAIDEVSRLAGAYATFSPNQIRLQSGKRPAHTGFAGPFYLETGGVREDSRNAAGELPLSLHAANLPPKVAALFAALPLSASIGVTGPTGQDLFFAQRGMASGVANYYGNRAPGDWFVTLTGNLPSASFAVPLKDLLRDVDVIREVRLTLRAALPREMHALRLDPVTAGGSVSGGGVRLTLLKVPVPAPSADAASLKRYEFRAESPGRVRLCWLAHLAGGGTASGWASLAGSGEVVASLSGEASRFDFKVWGAVEEAAWDLTLREIPLARPPRRLEPPRFEGHAAPVRVSEARLTDKGVSLKIVNDCQKDLERVEVGVTYRDGDGRVLSEVARRVGAAREDGVDLVASTGGPLFDPRLRNEWAVQDPVAVPSGTRSVTTSVKRVLFKDGTSWAP